MSGIYVRKSFPSKPCVLCSTVFVPRGDFAKFCSDACRTKNQRMRAGNNIDKYPKTKLMSIWKAAELSVAADLMKKGYEVFSAISPSTYCDILAKKLGGSFLEIEVRTGYKGVSGRISFTRGLRDSASIYGVLERNSDEVSYFDEEINPIEL